MTNRNECLHETDVLKAIRLDRWTDELREHTRSCPVCQRETLIGESMRSLSRATLAPQLPAARTLWLNAQYSRRQERLSKLDLIALIGMGLVGTCMLLGILVWQFPALFADTIGLIGARVPHMSHDVPVGTPAIVLFLLAGFVWLITRDGLFTRR